MTLVRFDKVSLEFGDNPLLNETDLAIEADERVCLIGRNGAGKTSLLRLITGEIMPDHGEIERLSGLRVSQLDQNLPESVRQGQRLTGMTAHQKSFPLAGAQFEFARHGESGA